MSHPGFFDLDERYAALSAAGDPLEKLSGAVDFEVFRDRLLRALRDGDVKALSRAPGVGAKMAERMGVELRDAAGELLRQAEGETPEGTESSAEPAADVREQLLSALLNLGYPRNQAERVVDVAASEAGEDAGLETLIRVALRRLAR